jgi:hypothetical protein
MKSESNKVVLVGRAVAAACAQGEGVSVGARCPCLQAHAWVRMTPVQMCQRWDTPRP